MRQLIANWWKRGKGFRICTVMHCIVTRGNRSGHKEDIIEQSKVPRSTKYQLCKSIDKECHDREINITGGDDLSKDNGFLKTNEKTYRKTRRLV